MPGRVSSGYRVRVLALLLVAASVGMSNFGAAIGIGVSGVDARTRLRVGLIFGVFESGMPVVGLIIGEQVAGPLGHAARWIGAGLLIAVGGYGLVAAVRAARPARGPDGGDQDEAGDQDGTGDKLAPGMAGTGRLILSGLALSMDNLAVGFALGTYRTSIAAGALTIGVVSVALSLVGLELGARIGKWAGERGEQLAALVLISVGIAIASGAFS